MFDYAGGGAAKAVCGGVEPSLSNDTLVQVFREGWGPNDLQPGKVCGSNGAVTTPRRCAQATTRDLEAAAAMAAGA